MIEFIQIPDLFMFGALMTPKELGFGHRASYRSVCRAAVSRGFSFCPENIGERRHMKRVDAALGRGMVVHVPINPQEIIILKTVFSRGFQLERARIKETVLFSERDFFLFPVEQISSGFMVSLAKTDPYDPLLPQFNPGWDPTL